MFRIQWQYMVYYRAFVFLAFNSFLVSPLSNHLPNKSVARRFDQEEALGMWPNKFPPLDHTDRVDI